MLVYAIVQYILFLNSIYQMILGISHNLLNITFQKTAHAFDTFGNKDRLTGLRIVQVMQFL